MTNINPKGVELVLQGIGKEVVISPGGFVEGSLGAWACVLRLFHGFSTTRPEPCKIIQGTAECNSKNRMTLLAAVKGLKQLDRPCIVYLLTDSGYILNGGRKLLFGRTGCRFVYDVQHEQGENWDLWQEFEELSKIHRIYLEHVPEYYRHKDSKCAADTAAKSALASDWECMSAEEALRTF